jgi:hypothetical protein
MRLCVSKVIIMINFVIPVLKKLFGHRFEFWFLH